MTRLDEKMPAKITALFLKLAAPVTFYQKSNEIHDPVSGSVTFDTTETTGVLATPRSPYTETMINGDTVKRGDVRSMVAHDAAIIPRIGDEVVWPDSADRWQVVGVSPVQIGETIGGYQFQARRT